MIHRILVSSVVTGLSLASVAMTANAAAVDPWTGTWVLDVAKSSYTPGPGPTSETIVISDAGGGRVKTSVDHVFPGGKPSHVEFTYAYDGHDYPTNDSPGETISVRKTDASTLAVTIKVSGKVTSTSTSKLSADGMAFTSTGAATMRDGSPVKAVAVYERK